MGVSRVHGKAAIITGASSGIGRSTALAFAREGIRLALASRRLDQLQSLEQEVRAYHNDVFSQPTDVTVREQVETLVKETLRHFGSVDIVVCNAGQYIRGQVQTLTADDFERTFAVNFYGSLYLILEALPGMLERRAGTIVAVSSVDGKKGLPLDAAYVASKFAITGYMDVLRQELKGTGVHALTILPGRVDTPMIAHLDVPWVSRKISSDRVARTIMRGLRRGGGEMIVPVLGPTTLVALNAISARWADWVTRLFRLEGKERTLS